jgi:outer membrane biosynthesis protein TonB
MSPRSDWIASLFCVWLLLISVLVFAADTQRETRKIVHQVAPLYPALAKNTHTFGAVKLNVTVDRNGTPKIIEVVGGNPLLVKAAQESVNKWQWAPAAMDTNERVVLRFQPD